MFYYVLFIWYVCTMRVKCPYIEFYTCSDGRQGRATNVWICLNTWYWVLVLGIPLILMHTVVMFYFRTTDQRILKPCPRGITGNKLAGVMFNIGPTDHGVRECVASV